RRWWPRGYGEAVLYAIAVELLDHHEEVADLWEKNIGFRDAGVVEELDEIGMSFHVVVNDVPILIKGANWIPDDCFPTRLTVNDYRRSIGHALDAGMNMLRVWGGGLYESEDFYRICDEEGILVWQDFLMVCAAYSEEELLRNEIEAEAREQIQRLAWHASLVHWNGSNENVEGYHHWGWNIPAGVAWGNGYYTDLFPRLLADLDPSRTYTPSSPYSRPKVEDPRNPAYGTVHNWVVWNQKDYQHYRDDVPRFAAEFGFQGPPNYATIENAITERPLQADSPALLSHQKAADGQLKLERGYEPHFPTPQSFDDFHYTTQLNQARALTVGVGYFRSLWPTCGGTIIWQLNDCWPVTSWAAVDGDGRRKLLWYAMRDLAAPLHLCVQPRDDQLVVTLGNDTDEAIAATLRMRRMTFAGEVREESTVHVDCAPRSAVTYVVSPRIAEPDDPAGEVLVVDSGGDAPGPHRAMHFFAEDKVLSLDPTALDATATLSGNGVDIRLTARSVVRDVCVFADRVDPDSVVSDQLITLLPGESTVVRIATQVQEDLEAFLAPPVLRHVAELVAGRAEGDGERR
ncbi:MAG: glycoside hydrolase family 2 protein, partial [Brachybacterium sp.]|nr:glycoside hydrolase family 2 protein [Brachybacterium sp.]